MTHAKQTHFGFKTIGWDEKTSAVRHVFDSVASRYDIMNDVMSLGLHRVWKREFVRRAAVRSSMRVLDLAGGTGDIANLLSEQAKAAITVCDINQSMLEQGRTRFAEKPFHWLCGNAESLPLPSLHFDLCTIAFGIRNVTDIPSALRECHRVLGWGGHFLCLEFSHVHNEWLRRAYDRYSFTLIPKLGRWIANDEASYEYLVESIRRFSKPEAFSAMLREAGFQNVSYQPLSGGVVAIHSGWKL